MKPFPSTTPATAPTPNPTDCDDLPLLSVFMLTYNHEKVVAEAIESILAQKTDFPFELVISDDASSDRTAAIVDGYARRYPDIIKLRVNETNLGMVANYFATVGRCRGRYVALCAGDDRWLEGKAALQVAYLEQNPEAGMVYSRVEVFHDDGTGKVCRESEYYGGPIADYEQMLLGNPVPAVSVMAHRELVLRYEKEIEPVGRGWLTEDFPMWLWFALCSRIGFIDEVTAVWRCWRGSLSNPENYVARMRFYLSAAEVAWFFAERHYGPENIPDSIATYYRYRQVYQLSLERDYAGLRALRGDVQNLRARVKNSRTRKMIMAVNSPRLYSRIMRWNLSRKGVM